VARRVTAPLCVFDAKRCPTDEDHQTMSWTTIPTCKDTGLPVEYLMLRGIFMPGGVSAEQVAYYVESAEEGARGPRLAEFPRNGGVQPDDLERKEYEDWVAREEARHIMLMKEADSWRDEVRGARGRSSRARR